MTALPKRVASDIDARSWNLLLSAEKAASEEQGAKYREHLVAVRVLGFFLLDFYNRSGLDGFSLTAYNRIMLEIKSCFDVINEDQSQAEAAKHAKVFEVGLGYRNNLMRIYRSNIRASLVSSSSPKTPLSFDRERLEIIKKMRGLEESRNTRNSISAVRTAALFRDGFKCMITGGYDINACSKYPEMEKKVLATGVPVIAAECTHLFSPSAQVPGKLSLEYNATTAFTMLKMFGLEQEVNKILGMQVNSLSNFLTLSNLMYHAFDHFEFWLEAIPGLENTYKIAIADCRPLLRQVVPPPAEFITFKVDPEWAAYCKRNKAPLPALPSRDLLGIRAACARVANISGAADQIVRMHRDEEDTSVMAHDGSTGELLTSLLNARVTGP